jgi:ribose 5-phosphate isomerase A
MVVGLGTGSTARHAIRMIGERLCDGRLQGILGVPTSSGSERLARELGIPLTSLREHPTLDLTIDGADEVGPNLTLIKGGGGALVHERIVATASREELIIIDESKLVDVLGSRFPLPVEVVPVGWGTYIEALRGFGCEPVLRMRNDEPYVTDEGNYIIDCRFSAILNPADLKQALNQVPGVVDNGIFIGLASRVIVASEAGVRELLP